MKQSTIVSGGLAAALREGKNHIINGFEMDERKAKAGSGRTAGQWGENQTRRRQTLQYVQQRVVSLKD